MFTGIVEEKGCVDKITESAKSCKLSISAKCIFDDLKLGDSVAVNGVCLTVTEIIGSGFTADVMPETMRRSSIGALKKGSAVNLERAMQLNGRFGGHIVSGHIDGTGRILKVVREDNAILITISADSDIMKYIIHKGSVTLDGISLTVCEVMSDRFMVSIIPHTAKETTLGDKVTGDVINIECDVIGKYVEKLIKKDESKLTMDYLIENGF